ncbi:hypothetical protein HN681_00050 [archaeon]|jgi:hypothetical protein|nr:hypothetical protein [archaeon]MBT3730662.1 hypothetical protein [archaeon]MBT4669564.1 hypothetical protein [archaeon]MBT5030321.1 hypothetical protein [archaeon]MBT5288386.1 hypothetical protein [archaeon]
MTNYDRAILMGREDIRKLVEMPEEEFNSWLCPRASAVLSLLDQYKLAASIPSLLNQGIVGDMNGQYGGEIDALMRGAEYLEVIRRLREPVE